jgi:hypothetical protein
MSTFQDCIVSFLDLNNLSTLLDQKSAHGVKVMRALHQLVTDRAHTLTSHEEVCFWQDSVLLLASVDVTRQSYQRAMSNVATLKDAIDTLHPCHAVSVKGQSFPAPSRPPSTRKPPRTIYLAASSLAFSNCFTIEGQLKRHKADWYIDSRIIGKIKSRHADEIESVILLPRNVSRKIHVFRGSFT